MFSRTSMLHCTSMLQCTSMLHCTSMLQCMYGTCMTIAKTDIIAWYYHYSWVDITNTASSTHSWVLSGRVDVCMFPLLKLALGAVSITTHTQNIPSITTRTQNIPSITTRTQNIPSTISNMDPWNGSFSTAMFTAGSNNSAEEYNHLVIKNDQYQ